MNKTKVKLVLPSTHIPYSECQNNEGKCGNVETRKPTEEENDDQGVPAQCKSMKGLKCKRTQEEAHVKV